MASDNSEGDVFNDTPPSYMKDMNDVVIDLQYGDCGKGKVVKCLADRGQYTHCLKFIGGANAGHTIYHNGIKHVGHQVPSVMIKNANCAPNKEIICVIGPNCYIDIDKLDKELIELEDIAGKSLRPYMKIAFNAHVTMEHHIEQDKANDMSGSTHCGIRPTARDKYDRCGTRVIDIAGEGKIIGCEVVDTFEMFNGLDISEQSILLEGSQGYWLDINWGKYPYVTSSDTTVASVISSGIAITRLNNIWGVAKIYETYVGSDIFQPDGDLELMQLQIEGEEYGATTGRPRQCNWLNLDRLRQAIIMNDVSELIFNKCDILMKVGVFKLYEYNRLCEFENFEEMKLCIKKFISKNIHNKINITFSYSKDSI